MTQPICCAGWARRTQMYADLPGWKEKRTEDFYNKIWKYRNFFLLFYGYLIHIISQTLESCVSNCRCFFFIGANCLCYNLSMHVCVCVCVRIWIHACEYMLNSMLGKSLKHWCKHFVLPIVNVLVM